MRLRALFLCAPEGGGAVLAVYFRALAEGDPAPGPGQLAYLVERRADDGGAVIDVVTHYAAPGSNVEASGSDRVMSGRVLVYHGLAHPFVGKEVAGARHASRQDEHVVVIEVETRVVNLAVTNYAHIVR